MKPSTREVVAFVLWAVYCTVVSIALASGHFDFDPGWLLPLFMPANLLLGVAVPRWPVVAAPLVLTAPLGWLIYSAACPCHEDTVVLVYGLWVFYFALPGAAAAVAGLVVRRALAARKWRFIAGMRQ